MAAFELRISGLAGPLCVVSAGEDWRLSDLQKEVADTTSIPIDQQRLISGASILEGAHEFLKDLLSVGVSEILCVRSRLWVEIPFYSGHGGTQSALYGKRTGVSGHCKTIDEAKAWCHQEEDFWGFTLRSSEASDGSPLDLQFKYTGSQLGHNNTTGTTFVKLTPVGRAVLLDALRVTKGKKRDMVRAITDFDTMLSAVTENPLVFRYVCDDLRCNVQVAEIAVLANPFALQYSPDVVKDDAEIVRRAIEINAFALQHASSNLKGDREIVLCAMEREPGTIRYASEALREDPDICLRAVQKDGQALRHLPDHLRDNHKIVMAAVRQAGQALCFASQRLRADSEVVNEAMRNDPSAVQHAISGSSSL